MPATQRGSAYNLGKRRYGLRYYDRDSTFASNALASRVDPFEVAKVMGTSIEMLEEHDGTLIPGALASIGARLGAGEAEQDEVADRASDDG